MNVRQMKETALSIFWEPLVPARGKLNWKSLNNLLLSLSYKLFLLHRRLITPLKKVTCTFFPSLQTSVVNYIDQRTKPRSDQLFFVVFEWKDPFIQTVQDVSNMLVLFEMLSDCTHSWFVCVCVHTCMCLYLTPSRNSEEEWGYFRNFSPCSSLYPVMHVLWRSRPRDAFPWLGDTQHSACS